MRTRLIAAAAVLALVAAGCGGDGPNRREMVIRYIEDANVIQAKVAQPSQTVSQAGRELAKTRGDRALALRKLRRAALRIDAIRKQLAVLVAPAEARRLRALLLELMRREAALAREVAGFVSFVPEFQAALEGLVPAGSKLKAALGVKGVAGAKADALDTYAATLDVVLRRLRAMRPPAVSAPLHSTQVQTLERVRAAATALAKALREERAEDIAPLLTRLQRAVVSNQSLAAQRAQIAAVRAYNERVSSLDKLARRIHAERARLSRVLD
jgi:hypothetical protein